MIKIYYEIEGILLQHLILFKLKECNISHLFPMISSIQHVGIGAELPLCLLQQYLV